MAPFHSGLNYWQRQWLSDRLHKKHEDPASAGHAPVVRPEGKTASAPKKRKPAKKRAS
jgi:hypothetical protein